MAISGRDGRDCGAKLISTPTHVIEGSSKPSIQPPDLARLPRNNLIASTKSLTALKHVWQQQNRDCIQAQ